MFRPWIRSENFNDLQPPVRVRKYHAFLGLAKTIAGLCDQWWYRFAGRSSVANNGRPFSKSVQANQDLGHFFASSVIFCGLP